MAIKKVEIKPPDGGYADVLYPKTSADIVTITDSGNLITATHVEGALQELAAPANLLAKLLTVDGNGSGLDADLLGGKASDRFISGSNSSGTQSWSAGINAIDKSGFYYIVTDTSGTPENNGGYVTHVRFHTDATHMLQLFVPAGANTLYMRRKAANVWQPWIPVGGTRSTTSGTNLNTLIATGIYEVTAGVNKPVGSNDWIYLEVMAHSSPGYVAQTAYDFYNNRSWTRRQSAGTWGEWAPVSNTFISATAPAGPVVGDIWIDTSA